MSKYAWEFEILTDFVKTEKVPVWHDLTEEERERFKQEFPEAMFVPLRIKIDEEDKEVTKKEDLILRRRVPDIRSLKIQQMYNDDGKIYKNRFLVEESDSTRYIVKGKYKEFKNKLDQLEGKPTISFNK